MGGGGEHEGSLLCETQAKKLQNLKLAACKGIILRLRYQYSQVAIYIDYRLSVNEIVKYKTLILKNGK